MRALRTFVLLIILVGLATGCAADEGEGMSCGPLTIGASQEARDNIARRRTESELSIIERRTALELAQAEKDAEQMRRLRPWVVATLLVIALAGGGCLAYGEYQRRAAPAIAAKARLAQAQSVEVLVNAHRCLDGSADVTVRLLARGLNQEELKEPINRLGKALSEAIATVEAHPLPEGERVKALEPPAVAELAAGEDRGR